MMKISLGMRLQGGAFGGGNQFGHALADFLHRQGITLSFDLSDPALDIILLADPRPELKITAYTDHEILDYLRRVNPRALVLHRVNECDERKATSHVNAMLRRANRAADWTVFVSDWLRQLHQAQGMQPRHSSVIHNGADRRIFHAAGYHPWDGRGPLRIVTHHWSNHWLKGFDIYQRLDELLPSYEGRLSFTYIGNLPPGFRFRHSQHLPPMHGEALAAALRSHHVYLTASQFEPGGNHQNEGAGCGLPLLYRASGSMPEYCAGYGIPFTPETFDSALEAMITEYEQWAAKMPAYPWTAERSARHYLALFEEMLGQRETLLAERHSQPWLPDLRLEQEAEPWLQEVEKTLPDFLASLQVAGQPGRFLPAAEGLTHLGETIGLGFSCLALKTYYSLGLWEGLSPSEQQGWLHYIQSYQVLGNPLHLAVGRNAFIDPPLIEHVAYQTRRLQRLKERLFFPRRMNRVQRAISGETKQAIASLAQVNAAALYPYQGFPSTVSRLQHYLDKLNWAQPWEAGAHVATIAVFLQTEAPRFLPAQRVAALLDSCRAFLQTLLDADTGAYFRGDRPSYDQLINGAMKVLTALDWLESPIHCPEKLIDTCLEQLPYAEGCHLVDAVYVLYRCQQQTEHRRQEIRAYCLQVLDMIRTHYNPADGGFSYFVGHSQTHNHGVHIAQGQPVSDIHGTTLLVWALAMISSLLGFSTQWKVIRP